MRGTTKGDGENPETFPADFPPENTNLRESVEAKRGKCLPKKSQAVVAEVSFTVSLEICCDEQCVWFGDRNVIVGRSRRCIAVVRGFTGNLVFGRLALLLLALRVEPGLLDDGGDAFLVLPPVRLVQLGGQTVGRGVGIGRVEQRLYTGQDAGHVVTRTPSAAKIEWRKH